MRLISISEVQALQLELMKKVHNFLVANNIGYYLIAGSALGAVRHGGFIPWDDDIDIGMFREDYERFVLLSGGFDSFYEVVNFRNSKSCDFALTRIYFKNTFVDNPTISGTTLDKRLYFDIFPLDNVPDNNEELQLFEQKIAKKKNIIQRIDARNYGDSRVKYVAKKIISFGLLPFRQRILRSADMLMRRYEKVKTERVCSLCSQYSFKKQVMARSVYGTPILHRFVDAEFYIPEQIHTYLATLYGENYMDIPPVEKRRRGYDIYLTNEE